METREWALNGSHGGSLSLLWEFKGDSRREKKVWQGWQDGSVRALAAKSEFHPGDTHGKKATPGLGFKESKVHDDACTSVSCVKSCNREIF